MPDIIRIFQFFCFLEETVEGTGNFCVRFSIQAAKNQDNNFLFSFLCSDLRLRGYDLVSGD